jgi:putative ABC transport system permease protein
MMLRHLRHAARSLLRQPTFAAAAVLTLAFGIGGTTAVFAVVNAVLLKPLPYPDPERLVSIQHTSPAVPDVTIGQSHAGYVTYRRLSHVFDDVGLHLPTAVNITDGVTPERIAADKATAGIFTSLRVTPLLGRLFGEADERPGHVPVVVISEGLWRRRFDGDRAAVGRSLLVDGLPHEVIGVLPARVRFPDEAVELWLPLQLDPSDPAPSQFNYASVGRLRPGVTLDAAVRDLNGLLPRTTEFFTVAAPGISMQRWLELANPRVVVRPLHEGVVGDIGPTLWVIFGTIGFVLLAACTNVATLFLVRAEGRQRELAVLSALGAGRGDAVARFFAEGLLVAISGAVLGITGAYVALGALRQTSAFPIPRLGEIEVDRTVLLLSVGVTLLVALLSSAVPMLRFGRRDLAALLRSGGRGATSGRDRRRMQGALVAAQVALAFVLLAASTLMTRTFVELRQVQPGFDAKRALVFRLALPATTYRSDTAVMQFYDRLTTRFGALPGVQAVGVTASLPLIREQLNLATVWADGDVSTRRDVPPAVPVTMVSPAYFRALGVPLVSGRTFRAAPVGEPSDEAIVSASYASRAWGDGGASSALGRRVRFLPEGTWLTVVGVVGDIRMDALERPPAASVYLPLNSFAYGDYLASVPSVVGVVLRTVGDPSSMAATARREVAALDPALPVYSLGSMRELVDRSMARTSITALMLLVAAAVAMALGAIGLYGVVSYTVGIRKREIGLRIALGARPSSVARRFASEGAMLAGTGVAVGLVGALVVTRALRGLLYGVAPSDPLMLGTAAVLLVVTGVAASWIPARRAARLDPASVLSED